jgi:hypothetical protein
MIQDNEEMAQIITETQDIATIYGFCDANEQFEPYFTSRYPPKQIDRIVFKTEERTPEIKMFVDIPESNQASRKKQKPDDQAFESNIQALRITRSQTNLKSDNLDPNMNLVTPMKQIPASATKRTRDDCGKENDPLAKKRS